MLNRMELKRVSTIHHLSESRSTDCKLQQSAWKKWCGGAGGTEGNGCATLPGLKNKRHDGIGTDQNARLLFSRHRLLPAHVITSERCRPEFIPLLRGDKNAREGELIASAHLTSLGVFRHFSS